MSFFFFFETSMVEAPKEKGNVHFYAIENTEKESLKTL